MSKLNYAATAYNEEGLRFRFSFQNENWNGIEAAAQAALDAEVADSVIHQDNGPWSFSSINRVP